MRITEMSLDEKGTKWKTIELAWSELDTIKEAIKLVEGLDTLYLRDKVLIRINTELVVEKTIDGITISFEDYEEPSPVEMFDELNRPASKEVQDAALCAAACESMEGDD